MATVGSEELKTEKLKEGELELANEKKEEPQPDVETIKKKDVKWLSVNAKVGSWDGDDEGEEPPPFHDDDYWEVSIDVHTGIIKDWPKGKKADICYKVSDRGFYELIDEKGKTLLSKDGYVPPCLGDKYGDYIELIVNEDGQIQDWEFNLNDIIKDFKGLADDS